MSVAVGTDLQLRRRTLGFLAGGARCEAPQLQPSIESALIALRGNDLAGALRVIDRSWRTLPELASDLAPAFGWLLALEGRDSAAALGLLRCVSEPDPDIAALIVLTLLRQEHWEIARDELERSLGAFCVSQGSLLAAVARSVIEHPASTAPGWLGRGSTLAILGEVSTRRTIATLEVQIGSTPAFTQLLRPSDGGVLRRFQFSVPGAAPQDIRATLEGAQLLGGGRINDFALRGRLDLVRGRLSGWARLGWSPDRALRIQVSDEHGSRAALNARSPSGTFELSLRSAGLKGTRIDVQARLPDGHWQALPDSPVLLEAAVRLRDSRPLKHWRPVALSAAATFAERAPVDVIVPVYGDAAATLTCVDAVLVTLPTWGHLVVVDDANSDLNLLQELHTRARHGRMTLLRNDVNRGFAAAANRGLTVHPTHDAVLLNSDTCVYGDWLHRLREAAYGTARVGTVTPFSNNGSIVSYPQPEGSNLDSASAERFDQLLAGAMAGRKIGLPVGVGFCLYLRRNCLNEIGTLDETVFGAGYGEETDLCLRARRRGWVNLLAADVFVYHAGGVSFGARRQALLARSGRLINLRHPGYDSFVVSFTKADPLQSLRRELDEVRLRELAGRCVLMVTLSLPGGVDRYIAQRAVKLRAEGLDVLVLRPAAVVADPGRCELWTDALAVPNLQYDIPRELPRLLALLRGLAPVAVELQHFLGLDPRLVDAVRTLPSGYDVFVHDSVWICPRVTLIDGSGRYCGEPAPKVCAVCIRRNGAEIESLSVPALRRRSAKWLGGARRILAPSQDTAQRIRRHFGLEVDVQPHSRVVPAAHPLWSAPARATIRVALLGAIGTHKGYDLLLACAHDARRRRLPLEFLVIGYTHEDDPLLATGRVFITGPYKDPELPHLLKRERPHLVWLPSVAPETWSYTLDHALRSGLPIVTFDIGAIAERLRAVQLGTLLPLDLSPKAINNHLLDLAQAKESATTPLFESLAPLPAADNVDKMALTTRGDLPMKKNAENAATAPTQEEGIGASVQVLPLPPGMYLFAVTAAAANPSSTAGVNLPAVHVTPGPGVDPANVEFINGRGGHSAWLFAQGDMLVARVSGVQTTLVLTSVRAPGGDVLSIKIERLDARTSDSTATGASVAPLIVPTVAPVTLLPDGSVPMQISAHIRSRGDLTFTDAAWAGRIARGLWIESFSLLPRTQFGADDIEYKGLTASGFETPWIGDQKMCGTRGMAVPLVGFAVRLKPSPETAGFDCEYSGYFQSGATVGPLRNGAPCRSTVANDPLEGLQVKLTPRAAADANAAKSAARATRPARRS